MTDAALHELLFAVRRSARYHDRRAAFIENLHRATNVLTILLAGVVLVELSAPASAPWLRWLAAASALLGTFDLVVGFARRAAQHREFKREWTQLQSDVIGGSLQLAAAQQRRLAIEATEPPVYRALDVLCHNEIALAIGYDPRKHPEHFGRLPWYVRASAQIYHWPDVAQSAVRQ